MWRCYYSIEWDFSPFTMQDKTDTTNVMFHLWIVQALFGGGSLVGVRDEGVKVVGSLAHKKG
jgi:hypothetical protein